MICTACVEIIYINHDTARVEIIYINHDTTCIEIIYINHDTTCIEIINNQLGATECIDLCRELDPSNVL